MTTPDAMVWWTYITMSDVRPTDNNSCLVLYTDRFQPGTVAFQGVNFPYLDQFTPLLTEHCLLVKPRCSHPS